MHRFKSGRFLALVALTSLAIAAAIHGMVRHHTQPAPGSRSQGRGIEAERSSRRPVSIQEKSRATKRSETDSILAQLAPEVGEAAPARDSEPRKEPIRIKTH